jgi:hypothetical protein
MHSLVSSIAMHLLCLGSGEILIIETFLLKSWTVDLLIGSIAKLRTLEAFLQLHETYALKQLKLLIHAFFIMLKNNSKHYLIGYVINILYGDI